MKLVLNIAGIAILVIGGLASLDQGSMMLFVVSIVGGFILLGLTRIIEVLEEIRLKALQVPLTEGQIRTIIRISPKYAVESASLKIHPTPRGEIRYPLVQLDNEVYIRARVFYEYLSQDGDRYTFKLPNREPIVLTRSMFYYKGVELFSYQDQVMVQLKQLNMTPVVLGDKVVLE